jgi:hypothetical protein
MELWSELDNITKLMIGVGVMTVTGIIALVLLICDLRDDG